MKRFLLFVMLLIVGLAALPAFAQEVTPEPDTSPTQTVPISSGGVVLTVGELVLGIVAIFASGGVVGIGGAGYLANRLRNDPEKIAALERLGDSVRPETAKQIVDLSAGFNRSVNELTLLVTEALDRIPAASKSQEQPTTITNNVTLPAPEPSPPAKQDW